jgi:hypothetical protein
MTARSASFAIALLLGAAPAAVAQNGEGYLFREPIGLLTLRGGYAIAGAQSDVYSFVQQNLTLGQNDFNAFTGGVDLSFATTARIDISFGLDYSVSSSGSEFRNFVDNNNQPIEQTTRLQTVPLTTTLRYYLVPRGRSLGRYAWVPSHVAPYVGLGGGMMWYTFSQSGDFVDFQTMGVFHDDLSSSGRTLMGLALAGVNVAMGTRWAFTGEARYAFASAPLQQDFVGFHSIDLSGLSFTGGISLRLKNRGVR